MDSHPLGIGIIGAGQIIKRHALAYRSLPDLARLVAVAEIDPKRAEEAKKRFRFQRSYTNYADLLACEDIDAVSICTPAAAHAAIVIDAIRAGKHVLCEKPMATTLADADRIIAAAENKPKSTVSCVFQLRNDPTHRRMCWMIEQGYIGKVLFAKVCVRLRKSRGYYQSAPGRGSYRSDGGGVVINQAIHQIDALLSLLGEPVAVSAVMDTFVHPIEAEDTLVGWIRFAGGAIATVECSTCAKRKEFSIDVVGEHAGMRVSGDPDSQRFDWRVDVAGSAAKRSLRSSGLRRFPDPRDPKPWTVVAGKLLAAITRRDRLPPSDRGHTPLIREFLESALAGRPGPIPPREARRSLELTMALYESARTRRVVELPLDPCCGLYDGVDAESKTASKKEVQSVAS